jgi:uncharacterized RDD family membrane protein YckC
MTLTPTIGEPVAAPSLMPEERAVYASLTRRLVAALIDLLFVVLLCFGTGMALGGVFGLARVSPSRAVLISMVVGWLIAAVYKIGLQCSEFQATIGKLALGIKVTDREGQRLTLLRSMARYASELVSAVSMSVGYVMAGFTGRRQALHDILAGTLVVRRDVTREQLAAVPEAPRLAVLTRVLLVLFSVLWVGLTLLAVSMPALQRLRALPTEYRHGIAPMPRSPDELSRARALVKRVLEATQVYQGEIAAQLESGVPFAEVTSPAFQYGLSSDLPFVESIDAVMIGHRISAPVSKPRASWLHAPRSVRFRLAT